MKGLSRKRQPLFFGVGSLIDEVGNVPTNKPVEEGINSHLDPDKG
jgi:hypothetical protein